MSDLQKITEQQMDAVGVVSAPDVLSGTTSENKAVFDKMVRQLVAPAYNAAVEAINALEKAETGVQTAEAERVEAETAREEAEAARVKAETAREEAEAARVEAETAREEAEAARETAEAAREDAETGYVAQAAAQVEAAGEQVTLAESWAVGGTGTRTGEDTNNAKYWSDEAQKAAGGGVRSFNGRDGSVMPQTGDYTADMVGARPNTWIPTATNVGAIPATEKGTPGGVATLDDNGIVVGAQINGFTKAETLTKDTAALYGLGPNAVPDDVLKQLSGIGIGSIRSTVASGLNENWVLANGAVISANDYPLYAEAMAFNFAGTPTEKDVTSVATSPTNALDPIYYANGYYVILGYQDIYYSASLDGPFSSKKVASNNNNSKISGFSFANGTYVISVREYGYSGERWRAVAYYASDLSGPWTRVDFSDLNSTQAEFRSVQFINDQFVFTGYDTISGVSKWFLLALDSMEDRTGKTYPFGEVGGMVLFPRVAYENGKYIICATNNSGNTISLYFSEDIAVSWSEKTVTSGTTVNGFDCVNGNYVVFVGDGGSSRLFYVDDLGKDWTYVNYPYKNRPIQGKVQNIVFFNGAYYASYCKINSSPYSIGGVWSQDLIHWYSGYDESSTTYQITSCGILQKDNHLIFTGQGSVTPGFVPGLRIYDTNLRKLPTVQIDNVNTFIKVK